MQNRAYQNTILSNAIRGSAFFRWDVYTEMQDVKSAKTLVPAAGTVISPQGPLGSGDMRCAIGPGSLIPADPADQPPTDHICLMKLFVRTPSQDATTRSRTLAVIGDPGAPGPSFAFACQHRDGLLYLHGYLWQETYWSQVVGMDFPAAVALDTRLYLFAGRGVYGVGAEGKILALSNYTLLSGGERLLSIGSYDQALALWPGAPAPEYAGSDLDILVESVAQVDKSFAEMDSYPQGSATGRSRDLAALFSLDIQDYSTTYGRVLPPLDNSRTTLSAPAGAGDTTLSVVDAATLRVPGSRESAKLTLRAEDGSGAPEIVTVTSVDVENNQVLVARGADGTQAAAHAAGATVAGFLTRRVLEVPPDAYDELPSTQGNGPAAPVAVVVHQTAEVELAVGTYSTPLIGTLPFVVTGCGLMYNGEDGTTTDVSFGYGPGQEAELSASAVITAVGGWEYVRHSAELLPSSLASSRVPAQRVLSFTVNSVSGADSMYAAAYFTGFYMDL